MKYKNKFTKYSWNHLYDTTTSPKNNKCQDVIPSRLKKLNN